MLPFCSSHSKGFLALSIAYKMCPVIPLPEILIKNQNFHFIVFPRFSHLAGTHPTKSKI